MTINQRIRHYLEANDADHSKALRETGFWGRQAAGCLFYARDINHFMLAYRSASVQEPHTYGTFGGAIDSKEEPEDAVRREVREECGYHKPFELVPLLIFKSGSFKYSNFLAVVEEAFTPVLDWENAGFKWCKLDEWPHPLHPGMKSLLAEHNSMKVLSRYGKEV